MIIVSKILEKGDIVWAIDREKHFHPIVFLEVLNENEFRACILSTKPTNGNIKMEKKHIDESYSFKYKNTHLVSEYKFVKQNDWIQDRKPVGRLTKEGIKFIEEKITNAIEICYSDKIQNLDLKLIEH